MSEPHIHPIPTIVTDAHSEHPSNIVLDNVMRLRRGEPEVTEVVPASISRLLERKLFRAEEEIIRLRVKLTDQPRPPDNPASV